MLALGRLDGVSSLRPDKSPRLYAFVRKEAVLSSPIEGTQPSLSDLRLFEVDEAPGVPLDDVVEVSNYVAALERGLARMRAGMPLSNRLIREIHEVLLSRGRGRGASPGEFRRSQSWIGGSRPGQAAFVPPPPTAVEECMAALERFLHGEVRPGRSPGHGGRNGHHRAAPGAMFEADQARIEPRGRRAGSALRVLEAMKFRPMGTLTDIGQARGLSFPAVSSAMDLLLELTIVRELTGKRRNRLLVYDQYLQILSEGTERGA